jgi:hypothetical protein
MLPWRSRAPDIRLDSLGPQQLPVAGSLRKLNSGNWSAKLLAKPEICANGIHPYETNCDVTWPLHTTGPRNEHELSVHVSPQWAVLYCIPAIGMQLTPLLVYFLG